MPLDLRDKTDLTWLSALIADAREAAPVASFILVGAAARDVILKYGHDIDTGRATLDVDIGFAVPDWSAYDALRERLLHVGRFDEIPSAGNQERLYDEAARLLESPDFDYEEAGAWLLGRDARGIATEPNAPAGSHDHFADLIRKEVRTASDSTLLADMRSIAPARDLQLLQAFAEGFNRD